MASPLITLETKFKEAAELEFKGSGIHLKFAIGQLWKQHKQEYGCFHLTIADAF
jgi:hypothetical protein